MYIHFRIIFSVNYLKKANIGFLTGDRILIFENFNFS